MKFALIISNTLLAAFCALQSSALKDKFCEM